MNWDDLWRLFPRIKARHYTAQLKALQAERLYQAASTSQYHPRKGDSRSANSVMEQARHRVAYWARHLEENSDLAVGVLDDLVDRVVGTGIVTEPLIRDAAGEPMKALNDTIARAWADWGRQPEVSQVIPWGELQRITFRTELRDGEALARHMRSVPGYRYPGPVPYALDVLEPDYLPFDLTSTEPNVTQGIQRDQFGTVTAYHLYKEHPGELLTRLGRASLNEETFSVPASDVIHLRVARRLGQLRGISIFHACTHRLQDLTDYEESERLAAKIAASFSAAIIKSPEMPGNIGTQNAAGDRTIEMQPAMIFDNLLPGESVETIDSNRPSNALSDYRAAMLRAVSAGTGARYSTIARTWESSYTAMRQETVAMLPGTDRMQDYFVARFVRPVYEMWLDTAIRSRTPTFDIAGADAQTLFDADYRGPGLPWIDPLDEARADNLAIAAQLKSRRQVIRDRGGDPRQVDAEVAMDEAAGISLPMAEGESEDSEEDTV